MFMLSIFQNYIENEAEEILRAVSMVPIYDTERYTSDIDSAREKPFCMFSGFEQAVF
jgi:hypothetical protein